MRNNFELYYSQSYTLHYLDSSIISLRGLSLLHSNMYLYTHSDYLFASLCALQFQTMSPMILRLTELTVGSDTTSQLI